MIRKHDLHSEFPERDEQIHRLKTTDPDFRDLFDQYDEVDTEIHRIEMGNEVVIDEYLDELRRRRLYLKDSLYNMMLEDDKEEE